MISSVLARCDTGIKVLETREAPNIAGGQLPSQTEAVLKVKYPSPIPFQETIYIKVL